MHQLTIVVLYFLYTHKTPLEQSSYLKPSHHLLIYSQFSPPMLARFLNASWRMSRWFKRMDCAIFLDGAM